MYETSLCLYCEEEDVYHVNSCADPGGGGGGGVSGPPRNFGKNVVIGFVNGTGFILRSIYVEYNPD